MFDMKYPNRLRLVADALAQSETLVLTCHVRPDGDAIGSMLGLGEALEASGKRVFYFCEDRPGQNLLFLPGTDKLEHTPPEPFPAGASLVVLDCSEAQRIGEHGERLVEQAERLIVMDHHLGQDMCRDYPKSAPDPDTRCVQYINPDIFATGAICFAVIDELGWNISPDMATNFYAAILTDTGSFVHSNTTSLAFEMAARLVEYGADPYEISDRLFERVPFRKLALLSLSLRTLSLEIEGRLAMLHITPSMLEEAGAQVQDSDDFVRYARCIDGVEVSAFIKEPEPGKVSVSMRSRSWCNVAAVAKALGGGGHFHAAGFRQPGSAAEWREQLVEILTPLFREHDAEVSHSA